MPSRKLYRITSSAFLLLAINAYAENQCVVQTPNFYLVAGVGYGELKDAEYDTYHTFGNVDPNSYNDVGGLVPLVGFGYQFNPYVALEFNYIYLDAVDGVVNDWTGTEYKETSYAHAFATLAVLKYPLPFAEKVAVFAKLGPAYNVIVKDKKINGVSHHEGDSEFDLAYGAGLEYNFTHRFGVQAQYLATGSEIWATTGGVIVRF